ncbi:MAG: hypothetical protein E6K58_05535 [Nitrospirae bacterium]|nr:MAG: hypothetical protein E6K58_05535 [Nitrospirota bacterium]
METLIREVELLAKEKAAEEAGEEKLASAATPGNGGTVQSLLGKPSDSQTSITRDLPILPNKK